jgi:5-formyltetrahydrofolate cyclo-ligase
MTKDPAHRIPEDESLLRVRVKAELRKRMRGVRRAAPLEACAVRSRAIVDTLEARPEVASATHVALFHPIVDRHEVDLRDLDARLRARSVHVYYPSIDPETRVMTFRLVRDLEGDLEERGLGFAEPAPEADEAKALDAVIVPALAVDPRGYRIGYGAGFYDRALPQFCPPGRTLVVAFDYQLIAEVPALEHDVRCDVVVTDTRVIEPA